MGAATKIVNFRWPDDLVVLVDAAAKAAGQSRTKWVEQAVRQAAGVDGPTNPAPTSSKSVAPKAAATGFIHEKDCPHPWSAYRRPKEGLYCSACRKFVIEAE